MALRLPRKAHKQSPFFGTLWAIFMIRGPLTINTFHPYSVSYIMSVIYNKNKYLTIMICKVRGVNGSEVTTQSP
jgi:hypothetical protein